MKEREEGEVPLIVLEVTENLLATMGAEAHGSVVEVAKAGETIHLVVTGMTVVLHCFVGVALLREN